MTGQPRRNSRHLHARKHSAERQIGLPQIGFLKIGSVRSTPTSDAPMRDALSSCHLESPIKDRTIHFRQEEIGVIK